MATSGSVTVRIIGLDELRRKLGSNRVDGPVGRFLDRGAFFIQGEARRKAPRDTSRLANSIGTESPTKRSRKIGPSVDYGEYVETGTRPHYPPPAALEGWARRHGTNPYVVARAIARHGTKPQPYMQPAAEAAEPYIKSQVATLAGEIEAAYQEG